MALFETVCPGTVAEGLSELPDAARSRALFDRCKLGDRSGLLVSRAEFDNMNATPPGVHVLALAAWLSDHGVSASDTRTIGRELFRRASARGRSIELDLFDDTRLPPSESGTPPTDGVLVIVRRTALDVGAQRIVELDAGLVPADRRTGERIDPLYDLFAEEVDKARVLADVTAIPRERSVLLAADRDVPWTTLRQVLATASEAGLRRVDLLVLVNDSFDPVRALTLQDASRSLDELAVPADATAGDLVRLRIALPVRRVLAGLCRPLRPRPTTRRMRPVSSRGGWPTPRWCRNPQRSARPPMSISSNTAARAKARPSRGRPGSPAQRRSGRGCASWSPTRPRRSSPSKPRSRARKVAAGSCPIPSSASATASSTSRRCA